MIKRIVTLLLIGIFCLNQLCFGFQNTIAPMPAVSSGPTLLGLNFSGTQGINFNLNIPKNTNLTKSQQEQLDIVLKYFLTALTVDDKEFWVNLNPSQPDRMIGPNLAYTDMGQNLMLLDLKLKKDTAFALFPGLSTGATEYWERVFSKAKQLSSQRNINVPTTFRVWIVPDKAEIYEKDSNSCVIIKSTLKVMLESEYLNQTGKPVETHSNASLQQYCESQLKELILPVLNKKVNEDPTYEPLRQIYNAIILAKWYKGKVRSDTFSSLVNANNLNGLIVKEPLQKAQVFAAYLDSVKQGEYHLQKTNYNSEIKANIRRTYVSGGANFTGDPAVVAKGFTARMLSDRITNTTVKAAISWLENTLEKIGISFKRTHGLFTRVIQVVEGRNRYIRTIHIINRRLLAKHLKDFKLLFGFVPSLNQVLNFIRGHETGHVVIDLLKENGISFEEIVKKAGIKASKKQLKQLEEDVCDLLGIEFGRGGAKPEGDIEKIINQIDKELKIITRRVTDKEINFLELLKTSDKDDLAAVLKNELNIEVKVEEEKTRKELEQAKKEVEKEGGMAKTSQVLQTAEEVAAREFFESRQDLFIAIQPFQFLTEQYGYLPWKQLYDAAGRNVLLLFQYGLSDLNQAFGPEELKAYWPDLVELVKASEEYTSLIFSYLPALKETFTPEELKAYWPDLVELGKAAGQNAGNLFSCLSALKQAFSQEELKDCLANKVLMMFLMDNYGVFKEGLIEKTEIKRLLGAYLEDKELLKVRYFLFTKQYDELQQFIQKENIPREKVLVAIFLNNHNQIVSQTTDLILDYKGTKGVLNDFTSLGEKIDTSNLFTEKSLNDTFSSIYGKDSISDKELKSAGFRIFNHTKHGRLVIPLVFDCLLSAYRGSMQNDSIEASFLSHALTTAIIHYAAEGGERAQDGDEQVKALGNNAFHEFDLGFMMLEGRNNRQVDGATSLAFFYQDKTKPPEYGTYYWHNQTLALSEYARKRTVALKENTVADHINKLMQQQLQERRVKQNLYKLLGWIESGELSKEELSNAITLIKKQLNILKDDCGLKKEYFDAVFGYLDDAFLQSLEQQYNPKQNNKQLLQALFIQAMQKIEVVKVAARNGTPAQTIAHPWLKDNNPNIEEDKTLLDYLENEEAIRKDTFDEVDVSTIELGQITTEFLKQQPEADVVLAAGGLKPQTGVTELYSLCEEFVGGKPKEYHINHGDYQPQQYHWVSERWIDSVLSGELRLSEVMFGKPAGIWLSGNQGWAYWCKTEAPHLLSGYCPLKAYVDSTTKIFEIDSLQGLKDGLTALGIRYYTYFVEDPYSKKTVEKIAFEEKTFSTKLKSNGYAGIHLSRRGYSETARSAKDIRDYDPKKDIKDQEGGSIFYDWCCDSTVIFDPMNIKFKKLTEGELTELGWIKYRYPGMKIEPIIINPNDIVTLGPSIRKAVATRRLFVEFENPEVNGDPYFELEDIDFGDGQVHTLRYGFYNYGDNDIFIKIDGVKIDIKAYPGLSSVLRPVLERIIKRCDRDPVYISDSDTDGTTFNTEQYPNPLVMVATGSSDAVKLSTAEAYLQKFFQNTKATWGVDLAGALKNGDMGNLGKRDSTDEDAEFTRQQREEFERLALVEVEQERVIGIVNLRANGGQAKVVQIDLGKAGAHHFYSETLNCYVIIVNSRYDQEIQREGRFHEVREIYWMSQGFTQHEAHVIAWAEQIKEFAIKRSCMFTPYQEKQLSDPVIRQRILQETDRSWHHGVLEKANEQGAGINLEEVKRYEENLRARAEDPEDRVSTIQIPALQILTPEEEVEFENYMTNPATMGLVMKMPSPVFGERYFVDINFGNEEAREKGWEVMGIPFSTKREALNAARDVLERNKKRKAEKERANEEIAVRAQQDPEFARQRAKKAERKAKIEQVRGLLKVQSQRHGALFDFIFDATMTRNHTPFALFSKGEKEFWLCAEQGADLTLTQHEEFENIYQRVLFILDILARPLIGAIDNANGNGHKINKSISIGGLRYGLTENGEIIIVDIEKDVILKSLIDKIIKRWIELVAVKKAASKGAIKGLFLWELFRAIKENVVYNKNLRKDENYTKGNFFYIGETLMPFEKDGRKIMGTGVCRHMAILVAAILEYALEHRNEILSGQEALELNGKVFYVLGKGHAWALYMSGNASQLFVFDPAQKNDIVEECDIKGKLSTYTGGDHDAHTYQSARLDKIDNPAIAIAPNKAYPKEELSAQTVLPDVRKDLDAAKARLKVALGQSIEGVRDDVRAKPRVAPGVEKTVATANNLGGIDLSLLSITIIG